MHFGEHLTIDGYGGNFEKLNDEEWWLSPLSLPLLITAEVSRIAL